MQNQYKVKLRSQVTNTVVAFDVTPEVTETRNVNYKTMEPVHMPGGIHVYGSTSSRVYNINNIRLVSRTSTEASRNLYRLNVMRGWTMPYFGRNNPSRLVGAPPDVLALTAYNRGPLDSSRSQQTEQVNNNTFGTNQSNTTANQAPKRAANIRNVPVILQQLSIPYPSDTDYIPTAQTTFGDTEIEAGIPFPTIITIDMVLMETHSPREFNRFDLEKFRKGILDSF